MISRPTRTVSVGTTPVNIRKTPASVNDVNAYPVTFAVLRYGSGAIQLVPLSSSVYGDGQAVDINGDFNDVDQSLVRYAVAQSGTVSLAVTDYSA